MAIAGPWREGNQSSSFTMLTMEQTRMLRRITIGRWLFFDRTTGLH
jgi:hypothetical protein